MDLCFNTSGLSCSSSVETAPASKVAPFRHPVGSILEARFSGAKKPSLISGVSPASDPGMKSRVFLVEMNMLKVDRNSCGVICPQSMPVSKGQLCKCQEVKNPKELT